MSTTQTNVIAGAVLYGAGNKGNNALRDFATGLKDRGWSIGGITQQKTYNEAGQKTRIDAIALDTGDAIPIVQPSADDIKNGVCGLDLAQLASNSSVIRRAIDHRVDLMAVSKFGEQEQKGGGLLQELMDAMMAGIPTLVEVPQGAFDIWEEATGGLSTPIAMTREALWAWWPKRNLYKDLALGVTEESPGEVVVGEKLISVTWRHGCGLAPTPEGVRQDHQNSTLRTLALGMTSSDPLEFAIGLAAVNAFYNQVPESFDMRSGLDVLAGEDGAIAILGGFHGQAEKLPHGIPLGLGEALAGLERFGGAAVANKHLIDHTLPALLEKGFGRPFALIGPFVPMTPRLFDYGATILSGRVILDPDKLMSKVEQGAGIHDLRGLYRYHTLVQPDD